VRLLNQDKETLVNLVSAQGTLCHGEKFQSLTLIPKEVSDTACFCAVSIFDPVKDNQETVHLIPIEPYQQSEAIIKLAAWHEIQNLPLKDDKRSSLSTKY
jgi:hypothetical protein